jgi:AraC-like DNA-binding protein
MLTTMDVGAFRSSAVAASHTPQRGKFPQLIEACRAPTTGSVPIDFPDIRETLHDGSVATITLVSRSAPNAPAAGFADVAEIAIPYGGVFLWRVGSQSVVIDPNCALYIAKGQEFSEVHPVKVRGHAAACIEPTEAVLDELRFLGPSNSTSNFRTLAVTASEQAQVLAALFLHQSDRLSTIERDETTVALLDEVFFIKPSLPNARARRIVAKAKTLLHDRPGAHFSLADAANELGVTPIYLTHAFRMAEGIPLYRYYQRLRLAQSLHDLPYRDSLTDLALQLGYSSHSHFSAAFLKNFGITPSDYRAKSRSS